MDNGCLQQIEICRSVDISVFSGQSICAEAANMCRDNVEGVYVGLAISFGSRHSSSRDDSMHMVVVVSTISDILSMSMLTCPQRTNFANLLAAQHHLNTLPTFSTCLPLSKSWVSISTIQKPIPVCQIWPLSINRSR